MTIIELAREAAALKGHTLKTVLERETLEFIESFAALHRDEIIAELCKGVEMPEPKKYLGVDDEPDFTYYTADQLREYAAAAVAKEREECATLVDAIEARCIELDCDDPALFNVAAAIRNRSKA